jgi:hypothetical protein
MFYGIAADQATRPYHAVSGTFLPVPALKKSVNRQIRVANFLLRSFDWLNIPTNTDNIRTMVKVIAIINWDWYPVTRQPAKVARQGLFSSCNTHGPICRVLSWLTVRSCASGTSLSSTGALPWPPQNRATPLPRVRGENLDFIFSLQQKIRWPQPTCEFR